MFHLFTLSIQVFDNLYLFKSNKIIIISIYRVLIEIFQFTVKNNGLS